MKPVVFSWCSEPENPGWKIMKQTTKAWGWEHHEAWHQPMGCGTHFFGVFCDQFDRWRAQGFTHALWIDAFDMVCVGPPSDFEKAWEHYGNPALLVSAEAACWPGEYRLKDYPPREHAWWYAHSPCSVDLRQHPELLIMAMPERGYGSDQYHFADLILDKTEGVAIDRDTRVVMAAAHCHPWADNFEPEPDGRVLNKITGCRGLWVHGNGRTDVSWAPIKA